MGLILSQALRTGYIWLQGAMVTRATQAREHTETEMDVSQRHI